VFAAIMDFFASGQPVLTADPASVEEGTVLFYQYFCVVINILYWM